MTDYRLPELRRDTFLKFYEFHLKYRSHPGAVYYLIPHLRREFDWSTEQTLWFTFLNGNTQNPTTSLVIARNFPDPRELNGLDRWFNANFDRLKFDHDRRYQKKDFLKSVQWFVETQDNVGHQKFWEDLSTEGFTKVWKTASKIPSFGRLSTFSFLEYQRIAGLPIDCDTLFLRDLGGSKSHRNGLCKLLGHDELDWHSSNPDFNGKYHPQTLDWLESEGETLISEAKRRFKGRDFERDVTYFTLESTLCTFKSWFRPNRRYPNVYNDMLYLRIKENEKLWPEQDFSVFWEARRSVLPQNLRLEDNPHDPGLSKLKQNWFREHGEVIMMDKDFPEFTNLFNHSVDNGLFPLRKDK